MTYIAMVEDECKFEVDAANFNAVCSSYDRVVF
jgi:hypothetical protein